MADEKAHAKHLTPETRTLLAALRDDLAALADWNAPAIHELLNAFATARGLGLGKVAQPLRVALSGGTVSPPIDATATLLGRETVLARLQRVI